MPMKGRFPIRRTLEYLQKGEVVFNNSVKIMTVNYNTHGDLSEGARFYLDDGEQVRMDVEGKDYKEITQHVKKILGKSDKVLEAEALAKMELSNPANFGPKKYFLRECMSEVEGQVPHPRFVPLPKEMTGKYRAKLAAGTDD
ncbi:28S ribosomal protein S25, mitochondrial [Triplophysa tibetana]|uniref:28S ribosomal protein S25, mitochondrial n=1 Tax=Triplophysa tibetana TaxID=1572043 RepID=A0A5A9NVK3_9TELE|nr:28S ribosomal protein S25, mitochondrial [Triplophysa tibetana]